MTTLSKLHYSSLIPITITLRPGLVNLGYFRNRVAGVRFALKSALFTLDFRLYTHGRMDLLAAEYSRRRDLNLAIRRRRSIVVVFIYLQFNDQIKGFQFLTPIS
jgi:hypothetical protein